MSPAATAAATSTSPAPSRRRSARPSRSAARPLVATSNPGIVLPVYICSAGVNCATAADRQLNPNNPYAAAFAADPANGAARIYYLFGDIPAGSERTNEVYRFTAGLNGSFGDDWNWRVEGVVCARQSGADPARPHQHRRAAQRDQHGLVQFRQSVAEQRRRCATPRARQDHAVLLVDSTRSMPRSSKTLVDLPGGPLQFAIGGQVRREKLDNNNQNAALDTYGLTTSSAFGQHTVWAGYFELDAPILTSLDVNVSGRYDHYSEGFGRFSPKVGVKFTPIPRIGAPRHLFAGLPRADLRRGGSAQPVCRLRHHQPAGRVLRAAWRFVDGDRHLRHRRQPVQLRLFGRPRLRRQPEPEAGKVAQLHRRRDLRSRRAGSARRSTITTSRRPT